ncbi:MAG: hypothetical protein K2W82_04505 [Candidatus Obscuribacterales bacterium]|nr:hypothetical protein [Candidatus Obscuribacterales bacterium]
MLLVNSSFVGGFGAARKAASFVKHIEQHTDFFLLTDSASLEKLKLVGLEPDRVINIKENFSAKEIYAAVETSLTALKYDALVSFGWRTFVPAAAVEKGVPAVIVDGGWPERLESHPSPFCKDVYTKLKTYYLTSHFFSPELNNLLSHREEIAFEWMFHPFQEKEIRWHTKIRDKLKGQRLPYYLPGYKTIFLDMSWDYVDPKQAIFTGGWLKPKMLDECRGFVTRLLMELDSSGESLLLIVQQNIAKQFEPVIAQCRTLKVVACPALSPEEHQIWRAGADLVLLRAARSVGAAQVALSDTPALHMICPASDDYMGELSSCKIAEKMGIAKFMSHENESLAQAVMNHLESGKSLEIAKQVQSEALSFWKTNGPDCLLDLVLEKAC